MTRTATLLTLLVPALLNAQVYVDTTYRVEMTVTASPTVSLYRNPSVPGTDHKASIGGGLFVRGMWHPGRLLSVGFITGYMFIDQDDIPAGDITYHAHLTAIPMQFTIAMQKNGLEVGMGVGPYMMLTAIEGGQSAAVHGTRLELGLTFFGSYEYELNDYVKIGPELRVLDLRYRGILSIMPSFSVRIDPLRY